MKKEAPSGVPRLLSVIFAVLTGLYLLAGGVWLCMIGGSPYYAITGIVMLVLAAVALHDSLGRLGGRLRFLGAGTAP